MSFTLTYFLFKQAMKRILLLFILIITTISVYPSAPPPADEVFQLTAKKLDPNAFLIEWTVKPGFFLYRDRIHFIELPDDNFHLAEIRYPKAIKKTDTEGKTVRIYRNNLSLSVPVLGVQSGESLLNVCYQGCADDGFCYPPQTTQIKLAINDKHELINASVEPISEKPTLSEMMFDNGNQLHQLFSTHNWALIFLSFFGFGLLLSFTPCVLPMVPVLSGIIVGQGKNLSTHKAFLLSLSYVLSMACTYAIIGATIALIGSNLQVALQSTWVIAIFSFVFIILSLSMFGFFELQLPSAWQTKLSKFSHSKAGGYYLGSAIMGCLSTLILSPCVTAPLIGALGYIANTGDITRGSIALFFMGLGIGTPLLLIGTSAGKWLPKAGAWMDLVKAFFGLLLLGVAIDLLSRILPAVFSMGLWATLLIFTGIYAGALTRSRSKQAKFRQAIGIISLTYGILILIGASQGSQNPLEPLIIHPASISSTTTQTIPNIETLTSLAEVKVALDNAKGMPVLIDFYADWCATCQHIEATTLKDPDVIKALNHFIFLRVDITENNSESRALLKYFNVVAPPTFIFYNANGTEQNSLRLVGDINSKTMLEILNKILVIKT